MIYTDQTKHPTLHVQHLWSEFKHKHVNSVQHVYNVVNYELLVVP